MDIQSTMHLAPAFAPLQEGQAMGLALLAVLLAGLVGVSIALAASLLTRRS